MVTEGVLKHFSVLLFYGTTFIYCKKTNISKRFNAFSQLKHKPNAAECKKKNKEINPILIYTLSRLIAIKYSGHGTALIANQIISN